MSTSYSVSELRQSAQEALLYTAASAAALCVDVGILTLLVAKASWNYLPAAAVSFIAGGVFLYGLSVRLVFRFRRISRLSLELPAFLALGFVGLVVSLVVVWLSVEALHLHYLLAKASASLCTFTTNFLLRRNLMFSRVTQSPAAE